jgi:hypothetical protein
VRSFKIPNWWPIAELFQTAGASITANFFHHVAQSAGFREIIIDLAVPDSVIPLADECSELCQFLGRELINGGLDFGQAHTTKKIMDFDGGSNARTEFAKARAPSPAREPRALPGKENPAL